MHKGNYAGLQNGLAKGTYAGLRKGLTRGEVANNRGLNFVSNDNAFTVGVIGDSIANGAATVITPARPNTLWDFDGDKIRHITSQTVNTELPYGTLGSWVQSFANELKSRTGRKTFLINGAHGQSCVFTSTYSWYTDGSLYDEFKAKVSKGLRAFGRSRLDAIVIHLSINDVRIGRSLANITTGWNSLISRLNTDFPGVPKLIMQLGRMDVASTSNATSQVLQETRELLIDYCDANADFHMCGSGLTYFPLGSEYYESDFLHYNHALNRMWGGVHLANWVTNSNLSKWGRSVIAILPEPPEYRRKKLIDDFISSQVTSGNYFNTDAIHHLKTNSELNTYADLSYMGCGLKRSTVWTQNDSISTNGTSTFFDPNYANLFYTKRSVPTDFIFGVKVKTRTTTGTASLFGATNAGATVIVNILQQAAVPIIYRSLDATNSNGTDVLVQAGNLYSVGRNGTTKQLYKNKTLQASATQASTGDASAFTWSVGAVNGAGTRSGFIAGSYEYVFAGKRTGIDLDNFYDNMETLITNW